MSAVLDPPMSPEPSSHPGSDAAIHLDKRRERWILVSVCTALVAVMASVSGLNVAQRDLAVDLGASQGQVLWIINSYTLALAAFLLPVGAVGDRWGRRPVLLGGLALFAFANVTAVLAQTTATMIAARSLAGLSAAMVMPVTLSVITSTFPEEDRAKAIGIWAGFAGSGGMIGMFVSAFTVDVLTWRWLFALPLALIAVSGVTTLVHVPNTRDSASHRFDVVGSVLSAAAVGGLVLGIHEGPERGWTDPLSLAGMTVGLAATVLFALWELRHPAPLLDVRVFADRRLTAATTTITVVFAVMFGSFLVLFPFMQAVLGWSALHSAAGVLPMGAMIMPMSTVAPRLAARHGSRNVTLVGLITFATGLALLAMNASVDGGYFSILPGLMVLGLGMGLSMTPSTTAITESLPPDKQGVASALNDTTRELGGALGVALLGSILSAGYRSSVRDSLQGLPDELVERASDGIGMAMAVAPNAGDAANRVVEAAQLGLVSGWTRAMWIGVVIALVPIAMQIGQRHRSGDGHRS